jgi:preprotein translocase subunit SecD
MIEVGGNPQLSAFWRQRMTKLVPASQTSPVLSRRNLIWLAAAAALTLLPPTLYAAPAADEERPGVLIYQINPKPASAPLTAADMEKIVKVVDQRLNAGEEKLAKVKKLDDRRIEVALVQPSDANSERVKRLLARPGTLEFRIVADKRVESEIIDRAQKDASKDAVLDASGKKIAWWVPVKNIKDLSGSVEFPDIAVRTRKKAGREITEILVVADHQNVTGDYLTRVEPGMDSMGKPTVNFRFNKKGGELFGELTGEHLPDTSTALGYKLAIILDGELFSAPTIRSTIYDRGQITGSFSKDEVSDLANTLNAGSMPGRLSLVEKPKEPR